MTELQLMGALDGLKALECSDLARYKAAVEAGQQIGWGYYFPYLLSRNRPNRSTVLLAEDEGSMCVFQWHLRDFKPRMDLCVAPTPMNVAVLRRCLDRANEFNGDYSARILRIDAKDAEVVSRIPHVRVRQRRMQYIYAAQTYADLSGQKRYTIRRNVALIKALPNVEVVPYSQSRADECHTLLQRWRRLHREAHGTAGGAGMSRRAIELAGVLPKADIGGEVVFVAGRLSAFAFGGEIRSGLGCSFERKCDPEIRGLSYFHFRSFLLTLQKFGLVNDGSDAGRAGLRQLKDSFRPVEMHAEYRATQHHS